MEKPFTVFFRRGVRPARRKSQLKRISEKQVLAGVLVLV